MLLRNPQPQSSLATRFSSVPSRIFRKRGETGRRVLIINGHPDPRAERFCAALSNASAEGVRSYGWQTRELSLGSLTPMAAFGPDGWDEHSNMFDDMEDAFAMVQWASQLVIVFPLWLNGPPPPLRRFFDEIDRMDHKSGSGFSALGRSKRAARIVVTMEFPAFAHRLLFRAGENALGAENPLLLPGVRIEHATFIGSVDTISAQHRAGWLQAVRKFGVVGE